MNSDDSGGEARASSETTRPPPAGSTLGPSPLDDPGRDGDGPLTVLLVEDDPGDARLLKEAMRESTDLSEAELCWRRDLSSGLARLEDEPPDAVLLDLRLPDSEGQDTVERTVEAAPSLPIVVLTGTGGEERAREALRAGAQDYLVKGDVGPEELQQSLQYSLERKRSELEFRRSEEHLREAQRIADVGHWVWSIGPDELYWSDQIYRMTGLDPGEVDPTYELFIEELVHPADRDEVDCRVRRALEGKDGEYEMTHRLLRPDGEVRWFQERGEVRRSESGEPLRMVGVVQDVTERVERKRELERREAQYRSLFEQSPDPITITREGDGAFVRANEAFLELVGYERHELDKLSAAALYENPEERVRLLEELRETGEVRDREVDLRTRTGERRVVELSETYCPISDEGHRWIQTIGRDVTERRRLEEELRRRALHDSLTGLANRALFEDRLDHARERVGRDGTILGLLFVDLDRFKAINESLGHSAGDRVLEEVADRLREAVRSADTVGRIGGDEFVVLLEEVRSEADVRDAADRVANAVSGSLEVEDRSVPVEVSVGALVVDPGAVKELPPAEELLKQADRAMFRAKEQPGTAAVARRLSEKEAVERPAVRFEREARLRTAIEQEQVELHYQPIVSLPDRRMVGLEALARWQDPELGEISPGLFIPLAERTGLIVPLGTDLLRRACREVAGPVSGSNGPVPLCVNLSGRELEQPDFLDRVTRVLEETGVPPERLRFEVTETAAVRESETLNELKRELGVELAVDDFGTGHATLAQLKEIELDAIKVDRSFVQGVARDEADQAIVESVLTLGERLGLEVIAEGIETEAQESVLRAIGLTKGQGFRYGRPAPADELFG